MAPEDVKKLLIVVSSFLVVFLIFFFLFWQPRLAELKRCQVELSRKQAELTRLERDVKDWPDTLTRERLRQYEEELVELQHLIPTKEEVAMLLDEVQNHARAANLEIVSLVRVAATNRSQTPEQNSKYIRVPYKISLGGSYFSLIKFLRMLEDSKRLITITKADVRSVKGTRNVEAEVQFNIYYSRVGVETG